MLEAAQKPTIANKTVLDLSHIQKAFARPNGEPSVILDDISFSLREGEIVGVLGRSGCGKSTLLRIAAGLMRPTSGKVTYQGNGVDRPVKGIAMVFQTFALFPWLTVLENVMAGLDALGMKEAQAREKSVAAIDLIGLDGFETAYPRELSGGMRQRVGFARALVVDPVILLMDEPFSALDVLTAETLRADFIDLWTEGKLGIKSVMLVTHNIEEAVTLCDRIIVLAPDPGRIAAELEVPLPQPRERLAPAFREIVDDIYARMTAGRGPSTGDKDKPALAGLALRLPVVSSHRIVGLLDMLAAPPFDGKADLRVLAERFHLEVDQLLPVEEAAQILGFVEMRDSALHLTAAGKIFTGDAADGRKRLFSEHLLRSVPLAAHIRHILSERPDHTAHRGRFLPELEDHLSLHDAEQTLTAVIDWGRYGEIFAYDHKHHKFMHIHNAPEEDIYKQAIDSHAEVPPHETPKPRAISGGDVTVGQPAQRAAPKAMHRVSWGWQLAAVALAVLAVGGSWLYWSTHRAAVIRYVTQKVERGSIVHAITVSGIVHPAATMPIVARTSGVIEALYCDAMMSVTAGQLCAKIDPRPYKIVADQAKADLAAIAARLEKDKADLAQAKTGSERAEALAKRQTISRKTLDNARKAYDQALTQSKLDEATVAQLQAALHAAEINLGNTDVISPVDGTVVARNVEIGQTLAAGSEERLFLVAPDLTIMRVDAEIGERDIDETKLDGKVTFTVESLPNRSFAGKVTQIQQSPQMSERAAHYDIVIVAPNPDLFLVPGMTATIEIVVDRRDDVLRAPDQALRYSPGSRAVPSGGSPKTLPDGSLRLWVLRDGKPMPILVQPGLDDGVYTEIVKGDLQPGDEAIVGETG